MYSIFTYSLYGLAVILLGISFFKDKKKTMLSLKRAWKIFINVLPQFIAILLFVGLLLALITPEIIKQIIGTESGFLGMLISSLLGAVTLVPVLIAFPIAAELLKNGAGITQIAIFVSTLTMVGFITLPMETKYLGKKVAILRNLLAYLLAFATAFIIGAILA
jgi:uncharacterized membrane protein YraQ (UPF0718 family)